MRRVKRIALTEGNFSKYIRGGRGTVAKAFKIIGSANVMTPRVQDELVSIGFSPVGFRGFNSHSGDCFLYKIDNTYYVSVGMANINKAGRGLDLKVSVTKLAQKFFEKDEK